jgi:hypothetical protein
VDEHITSLFPGSKKKRGVLITFCLRFSKGFSVLRSVSVSLLTLRGNTSVLGVKYMIIGLNISKLNILYFYGLRALSSEF